MSAWYYYLWNDGEVTKPATETEEGEITYICTVCGETKTESIEKLTEQPKIDTDTAKEQDGKLYAAPQSTAELLTLAGEGVTLTKDDAPVAADAKVGSGMVLTKADGTQETIIVKGDNDGDGDVTSNDARFALRVSVELEEQTDWQKDASLVTGGASVTSDDARKILRASVGLEEIDLV